MVSLARSTASSVELRSSSLPPQAVLYSLIQTRRRGLAVRVLLDRSAVEDAAARTLAVKASEAGVSLRVAKTARITSQTMLTGSTLLYVADRTFLVELSAQASAAERRSFLDDWSEAVHWFGNERQRDLQRLGLPM